MLHLDSLNIVESLQVPQGWKYPGSNSVWDNNSVSVKEPGTFIVLYLIPAGKADKAGFLHLFDPSNTTFVKHFIADTVSTSDSYAYRRLHAGYGNTTSAVDAIQFKMNSGNIDAGDICLYGIN